MDTRKHTNTPIQNTFKKSVFLERLTMKNIKKLVKTLAAVSTIGLGFATVSVGQAQAVSLVPNQEGEIQLTNTDLQCLDPAQCIDTTSLDYGYSVTSLEFDPAFGESRLFADDRETENTYGFGVNSIILEDEDAGTNPNPGDIWFRPVAFAADGSAVEEAHLEVGRFRFDFEGKTANEVRLDFFDVEDAGFSGILEVNGQQLSGQDLLDNLISAGPDSNIQTLVLRNVNDFVVQLGNPNSDQFSTTGDGVSLAVSVPESENVIGLSALAVAGVITLKRRKKASKKA
ncbi:hypothetical protein NIES267_30930 [Calothrix parasitica NIES-267]|uniref:PEP-CTERM protein-sorting domain-containing protein n=1 Tax=Calothrix parasitica NIES-267 TaxID=1973488 RepID=A0A1Z4LR01_9CYAN|nr:hypothetical protein NIES267_30930 [Calothrix parasitica NIES-267]